MQFPLDTVREVAQILQTQNLGEITLEMGEARLTLKRPPSVVSIAASVESEIPLPDSFETTNEMASEAVAPTSLNVVSPAVGVFREAKKPLQVGAEIKKKTVLGAVETLNIPTEVVAPQDARIVEILAIDGQGVEWGQPLLILEPLEASTP